MSDWSDEKFPDPFHDPAQEQDDEDAPVKKLTKYEYNGACMRLRVVNDLLDSLTPADAKISLFSFADRLKYGLRRNARRSLEP